MTFGKLIKLILSLFFWTFFAISLIGVVAFLYSKLKHLIAIPVSMSIVSLIGALVTSQEDLYDT